MNTLADKYMTISDAAKVLGCNPQTIRRRVQAGKMDAVVSVSKTWVLKSEVFALLKPVTAPIADDRSIQ